MSNFLLNFINQDDFEQHVKQTITEYNETLKSIDLKKFNSNLIDPIKLVFDKNVFDKSYEEIITLEIHRQRDKTNSNIIGYFHQNIFKYIKNCEVPEEYWDIIFKSNDNFIYYIELKNKHNTMNSAAAKSTYMVITIDKRKQKPNQQLRRISIDKFYEIVTGDKNAFKNLCVQLPITIEKIITEQKNFSVEKDTVIDELLDMDNNILIALYKLAFEKYEGF